MGVVASKILRKEINRKKIRERMDEMGMSYFDISLKLFDLYRVRLTPEVIRGWVTGRGYPKVANLGYLCKALEVDENYFDLYPSTQ